MCTFASVGGDISFIRAGVTQALTKCLKAATVFDSKEGLDMRELTAVVLVFSWLIVACSDRQSETGDIDVAGHDTPAQAQALPAAPQPAETEEELPVNPLRDVYFGNLHVHTQWSFDAYINGAIATPDDA